jgi:hypothetical protein
MEFSDIVAVTIVVGSGVAMVAGLLRQFGLPLGRRRS